MRDYFSDDLHGSEAKVAKPCRACTDFKSWAKLTKSTVKRGQECPLDKDELGRNTWSFLHTLAAYYPEKPTDQQQSDMKSFITLFSKFYPCDHCAKDMREDIRQEPPVTTSRSQLSLWFCNLHNKVNKKLGKEVFDCRKVDERWFNGCE